MTAFTSADLPTDIDSLEKLHFWTASKLQALHPDLIYLETDTVSERNVILEPHYCFVPTVIGATSWRLTCRISARMTSDWLTAPAPMWQFVEPLGE